MKKLIIALLACITYIIPLCQETQTASPLTGKDYLQKSRNQKISAWVLLGGGAILTAGGLKWFYNEMTFLTVTMTVMKT